jgi:hypothetical protein
MVKFENDHFVHWSSLVTVEGQLMCADSVPLGAFAYTVRMGTPLGRRLA